MCQSIETIDEGLLKVLHFYNHGVTSKNGSFWNPLTLIKQLCRPEDICVFKLDIDTMPSELQIAQTLINDPALVALVDEFA